MAGAPAIPSLFAQRVVIGVGDLAVSNNVHVILSTYALGSCIGVVAYDSVARVGGILHLMLPESSLSPDKAARQPAMFADTGLPLFFKQMLGIRAERARLRILVAGGANVIRGQDPFRIGERNSQITLELLARNSLTVIRTDIGGHINRTLHLDLGTGAVTLKTPADNSQISLAA